MRTLKNLIGTAIGFLMVLAFGLAMLALVYSLAASQTPALRTFAQEVTQEIRCAAGFPAVDSQCVKNAFAALEAEWAEVQAALAEAEAELERIAAREEELRALSAAVESFNLFENSERPYGIVTTGVRFASILEPEVWERAWCYVSRDIVGPVDPRIDVGFQNFGDPIEWARARDLHLEEVGLTRAQFDDAREHCAFPEAK